MFGLQLIVLQTRKKADCPGSASNIQSNQKNLVQAQVLWHLAIRPSGEKESVQPSVVFGHLTKSQNELRRLAAYWSTCYSSNSMVPALNASPVSS